MKQDLIALTAATLDEVLAISDPSLDDLYEMACALGQAVRLSRAGFAGSEALAGRIARGRAVLSGERPGRILAMLDEDALLAELEVQLDSEDDGGELYALLLDLDAHVAAAGALGEAAVVAGLVDAAVDLLQTAADAIAPIQEAAKRSAARRGVSLDDPARPLWDAVADASLESYHAGPLPAGLAAIIASHAQARVLSFPLSKAEAADERWQAAAAQADPGLPETRPVAEAPDGAWQLVLEHPSAAWELVCYSDPAHGISFAVQADGDDLPVRDDRDGRRAVTVPPGGTLRVEIDGEAMAVEWPA